MHTLGQLIDQIKPLDQDAMKQAKHRTDGLLKPLGSLEIGRASCRERVSSPV